MNREALIEAYRRQHPKSELNDVQVGCIQPLLAIQALHNWRHVIQGFTRPDGGFRACGESGIFVLMRYGRLSTFDDSGLTNLVLAAHEHHMRVDIGTGCAGAGRSEHGTPGGTHRERFAEWDTQEEYRQAQHAREARAAEMEREFKKRLREELQR